MTAYLDHAAATPMREDARRAWVETTTDLAGNPASIHGAGQRARRQLEDARERLAAVFDCDPIEVVLTSGGTESINLALKGAWFARGAGRDEIVVPDGEHHATSDTVQWLGDTAGARVVSTPLTAHGAIDTGRFAAALGERTVVATALVANNEVGTVSDVAALASSAESAGVPLHLDAVAAFGHVPLSFARVRGTGGAGVTTMSVSAHKIGGPAATGALIASRTARLAALHHGGGGQRDLRAGTQDVAGAVAFAVAAEGVVAELAAENERVARLRDALVRDVLAALPAARLLGDDTRRLPGNAHFLFPGASGESLLYLLDLAGVAVSTGSACQAGIAEPSAVVQAMGFTESESRSVLRVTLGASTTQDDVEAFVTAIAPAYGRVTGSRS